jgi:chemotaxis response regulator CheB
MATTEFGTDNKEGVDFNATYTVYNQAAAVTATNSPDKTIGNSVPCISCNLENAVDVLFRSVAQVYGENALAVVMTGMGQDGLRGCELISQARGQVIAQDEASSVVWGMPGFVVRAGLTHCVLPLNEIADEIVRRVSRGRRPATGAPPAIRAEQHVRHTSAQGGSHGV